MNTCLVLAEATGLRAIALYSHLLPAAIAVFLGWYAAVKTRYSKPSIAFLFFTLAVAAWLIGDLVLWAFPDYDRVAFFWSWLDFVNVVFFVLAAYFFGILARGSISGTEKLLLLGLCIPSFLFTVTGNSVTSFDHTWCEMWNNETAVLYKSLAEWAAILLMLFSFIVAWKASDRNKRIALSLVFLSLVLFLATFSITEYFAAQTAVYEINLYGLFVLPVFLIAMVFAITNLEVFRIRYLGTQILIYVLIILVASQLLFLESSTDAALNLVTLGISISIGIILLRNVRRELDALLKIEKLAKELSTANDQLHHLDRLKSQFLSFASHQLRAPLTAIKWQAEVVRDGTLGVLPDAAREAVEQIEMSASDLAGLVNEFLDLRKLEEGRMEFTFERTDLNELTDQVVSALQPLARHKKLALSFARHTDPLPASVDRAKFKQVIQNLVENSIKYTDTGSVAVSIAPQGADVVISVVDTGHGLTPDLIPTLFDEFMRARSDAKRIEGTGLGLYIAKQIMVAHKGEVWAESEGPGKGSTFRIKIGLVK